MEVKLKRFQVIYINGFKYIVQNMIEFKEETWIWQEYEVCKEGSYEKEWLTIEKNDNNYYEYYLYKKYNGLVNKNEQFFYSMNKKFSVFDEGIARVKNYFGNVDVDWNEKCSYKDYISDDRRTIISIEDWSDGREVTIGEFIDLTNIKFTDEIAYNSNSYSIKSSNTNQIASFVGIGISILFVFFIIFIILFVVGISEKNTLQRYLEKNTSKYTYVTSVTSNIDGKKAKVYVSNNMNLDAVVKDIIDGAPEKITEVKESQEGISLQTKSEYAYVYNEENKVYIQVSSKKYVENDGSTYHSRHNSYYHSLYRSTNKSTTYNSYLSSARQQSINSRKSSGGGTSSGK